MSGKPITILVADDDAPIRDLLRRVLDRDGYQLLVAADGRQALQIADQHAGPIDLLFSDIIMPEMSGVDLARAIKARRPETKIILTSAYLRPISVMDRSWHFIPKPYLPAPLLDFMRYVLKSGPEQNGTVRVDGSL